MNQSDERVDVTVLFPAYNEEEAIAQVLRETRQVMDGTSYSYEILVVDDASTDRTADIAEAEGVRVIRHSHNRGSGGSRKTGIRAAHGEWIVMMDADGTYPAKSIPDVLAPLNEYAQVIGARESEKGTYKALRHTAKEIIRRLASFLVGTRIPDLNTGLRSFHRDQMKPFLYLVPDGFSCVSSMTLAYMTSGLPVKFIPIEYYKRIGKSKFHPVKDTYKYLLTVIRIVSYFAPLAVFMPLALALMALGAVKSVLDLLITSSLQESDIILVVSGLIVGSLGVMADLIVAQGKKDYDRC